MARLERRGLVEPIRRLDRHRPAVPRDLPGAPAPLRRQRRGRCRHPRRPGRPDGPAARRADAARTSAGTRSSAGASTRSSMAYRTGADLYFVHSYVAAPADPSTIVAETDPWVDLPERSRGRERHRRPVPPRAERNGWPAGAGQLRGDRLRGGPASTSARPGRPTSRRPSSVANADAPPTRDPVPRRGRRTGRQGHPVRRPGRRGRPGRAGGPLRRRGRGRDRLPRHQRRPGATRHAPRGRRADGPERVHPARRSAAGSASVDDMRSVLRAGADKVALNTAAVADPDLIARCARRFGRQAVVVAIDARSAARGRRLGGRRPRRPGRDRPRRRRLGDRGRRAGRG